MVIADSMPPNSDTVPLIASFYFGSMLIISLATACTVITLHVHKQGDYRKPMPDILKKIFFEFIAKIFCIKIHIRSEKKDFIEALKKLANNSNKVSQTSKSYKFDILVNNKANYIAVMIK